jgi:hypothetical protein
MLAHILIKTEEESHLPEVGEAGVDDELQVSTANSTARHQSSPGT